MPYPSPRSRNARPLGAVNLLLPIVLPQLLQPRHPLHPTSAAVPAPPVLPLGLLYVPSHPPSLPFPLASSRSVISRPSIATPYPNFRTHLLLPKLDREQTTIAILTPNYLSAIAPLFRQSPQLPDPHQPTFAPPVRILPQPPTPLSPIQPSPNITPLTRSGQL